MYFFIKIKYLIIFIFLNIFNFNYFKIILKIKKILILNRLKFIVLT